MMKSPDKKRLVYTYRTKQFAGRVVADGGRKKIQLASSMLYYHEINKFAPGDSVTLYVTNRKPKRTENQNRYYWGVYLPMISDETGNDIDDLHELFKSMFLGGEVITVLGKDVKKLKSSADLTVVEFIEFIMAIEEFTGIMAPPTESFHLQELKHAHLGADKKV